MPDPLEIIGKVDAELHGAVGACRDLALSDGALDAKTKILIALALDAAHGADNGVKSLAVQALQKGASKEEILEAVRVAYFVAGVGSVYTAASGLAGVL